MKNKVRKRFEGFSKKEKKARVITEGTEVLYVACPMCGMNKSLKRYRDGRAGMTSIDLNRFYVLVTRVGGGRGSGFYRIDEKSLLLSELKNNPEYADIVGQIREQCEKILSELK